MGEPITLAIIGCGQRGSVRTPHSQSNIPPANQFLGLVLCVGFSQGAREVQGGGDCGATIQNSGTLCESVRR